MTPFFKKGFETLFFQKRGFLNFFRLAVKAEAA
jgi:hypothetical protein